MVEAAYSDTQLSRITDLAGEAEDRGAWQMKREKSKWERMGFDHPTIKQSHLEQFLRDPVMAAYVIMRAELDTFQGALLKLMWWVPFTIDFSGVGASKTERVFIFSNLRAVLIPQQWVNVYYMSLDMAESTFWRKYPGYIDEAPLFRAQFRIMRRTFGEANGQGYLRRLFKNGSHVEAPAPGFLKDAHSQASKRFNTVVVDEANKIEQMSGGVAAELLDRNTRASFNKMHPIWANHIKLCGHADVKESSPMWKRTVAYRKEVRDGSPWHADFTGSYADYRGKYQKYREDRVIAMQKRALTREEFLSRYGGIWTTAGKDFFSGVDQCCDPWVLPVDRRQLEIIFNGGGLS